MIIFFRRIILASALCMVLLLGAPLMTHAAEAPTSQVNLINPLGGSKTNAKGVVDINIIIGRILQQALTLVGSLALIAMLVGGAYWLVSAGNAERVKKGTQTMVWAAIGLFVVFAAYGLLAAVIGGLTGKPLVDNTSVNGSAANGASTGSNSATSVVVYYTAGAADIKMWKDPKENVRLVATIKKTTDCIKSTEIVKNGYRQITDPIKKGTGWAKVGEMTRSTNRDCGGPGKNASPTAAKDAPLTKCETSDKYKATHSCQPTKGWSTKKKKANGCVSNLCENSVLLSQDKIKKKSEGNSWKCCTQVQYCEHGTQCSEVTGQPCTGTVHPSLAACEAAVAK